MPASAGKISDANFKRPGIERTSARSYAEDRQRTRAKGLADEKRSPPEGEKWRLGEGEKGETGNGKVKSE